MKCIAALVCFGLLAGCSSGGGSRSSVSRTVADRILDTTPSAGAIVAVESEFARAARDEGQWTAFRRFAAENALIHGRNGPILADAWLATQDNPEETVTWEPKTVWLSCTGDLAISQGRFRDPQGNVGTFVTVWRRQPDRQYRWLYDLGAPDNPQPPTPEPLPPVGENDIVVTAIGSVRGIVADCPEKGVPPPPPNIGLLTEGHASGGGTSADGTLNWRWVQAPDGTRSVYGGYLNEGVWTKAFDMTVAPQAE